MLILLWIKTNARFKSHICLNVIVNYKLIIECVYKRLKNYTFVCAKRPIAVANFRDGGKSGQHRAVYPENIRGHVQKCA